MRSGDDIMAGEGEGMKVSPGPNLDLSIACDCGAHDFCGGSSQQITTCGQQGGSCKYKCHVKEDE